MKNLKPHLITVACVIVGVVVAFALVTKKNAAGERVFKRGLLSDGAAATTA